MKIEKDEITIRDFTEIDLPLMFKWLTDQRVLEYYEGRDVRFTMDTLSALFLEEIPDGFRMIIEYKKSPIGYAQAYQLSGELFDEYDYLDDVVEVELGTCTILFRGGQGLIIGKTDVEL